MIVAVTMVKDEADVIETTVRHMCSQVDHVIVADNLSTDGTSDILATLPCEVMEDAEPGYFQSQKMTALATYARKRYNATWVVPFDADEIWQTVTPGRTVGEVLMRSSATVAPAWIYDHVRTDGDAEGLPPQLAMAYRRKDRPALHKVACRTAEDLVIEMGNHQATYTSRFTGAPTEFGLIEVRHFPIRSVAQYRRKARQGAAALALTDLGEGTGTHWRHWNRLSDEQLADAFLDHWFYSHEDSRLALDPARVSA